VLGGIDPAAFEGRTVVHFSSSTPEVARQTAAWAAGRGLDYLSGAILVPTPLVGDPEALFLYAGDRAPFDRHVDLLRVLGGKADHLGADHGLASLHDVAMLELFFAGMTAFLHGAAMVTAQGVDAKAFLPYAQDVLGVLGHSLAGLAADVDAATYPGTEDNLAMELTALGHIVDTGAELGLDPRLDERLRESDRGRWQGRLLQEIQAEEPEAWAAWMRGGADFRFPDGESLGEHLERTRAALDDVAAGPLPALVVCHGGTIRCALVRRHPRGLDAFQDITVPNGAVFRVEP
jgi:hypothetical protein